MKDYKSFTSVNSEEPKENMPAMLLGIAAFAIGIYFLFTLIS